MKKELIYFCAKMGLDPLDDEVLKLEPYIDALRIALDEYELDPHYAYNLEQCALGYVRLGQYEDAIKFFKLALQQDPGNPDLLAEIGFIEGCLGNTTEAKKILKGTVKKNPQSTRANYELALHFFAEKNFPAAIKYFSNVIGANVLGIAYVHLLRGMAYEQIGFHSFHAKKDFIKIREEVSALSSVLDTPSLTKYLLEETSKLRARSAGLTPQTDQLSIMQKLIDIVKAENDLGQLTFALKKESAADISIFTDLAKKKVILMHSKEPKIKRNPWNRW